MKKPTIQEVANHAGVGIGTVSRVINNHPSVRPMTRARVQSAMDVLGYVPNPHARRIAGGRSYTVSVILPFFTTEFYTRLLEGVESVLSEQRYDLALFPLLSKRRLERYLTSHTLAYQTDGLIISSYNLTELFKDGRLPSERPVVLVDAKSPLHDSVYLDNRLGGRLAAEHLLRFSGTIFCLQIKEELDASFKNTVFSERTQGFLEAAREGGRAVPREHRFSTRFSTEGGRLALQRFTQVAKPPFNIFAATDMLALGVLEEAEQLGLRVGQDIRVLGFDGQPWAAAKGLSTLAQPIETMGARAATMLLERIGGFSGRARLARFEAELIERASTRPDPKSAYLP